MVRVVFFYYFRGYVFDGVIERVSFIVLENIFYKIIKVKYIYEFLLKCFLKNFFLSRRLIWIDFFFGG